MVTITVCAIIGRKTVKVPYNLTMTATGYCSLCQHGEKEITSSTVPFIVCVKLCMGMQKVTIGNAN